MLSKESHFESLRSSFLLKSVASFHGSKQNNTWSTVIIHEKPTLAISPLGVWLLLERQYNKHLLSSVMLLDNRMSLAGYKLALEDGCL